MIPFSGIHTHGIAEHAEFGRVYAYEVSLDALFIRYEMLANPDFFKPSLISTIVDFAV